ncbi:MAG: cation transporter, partial [Chloroflexi bacterium]|nr:cation transporter [Chloroflexota bacterium]
LEPRPADATHPSGAQRVGSLSVFSASLALLLLGVLTCWQGADKLRAGGVPAYGDITVGGVAFWMGWAMIGVLVATSAMMLPVLNAKRALSRQVGSAALQTDAASNQAHIMVALTAALGVLLTYFGWGWADPMVAIAVGGVILSDGWRDLRVATAELIDATPEAEIMEQLSRVVAAKPYVESHYWLARKVGRFIDADLLIAAADAPLAQVDVWRKELEQELRTAAWQLHDLTISFGVELPLAKYEDGPRNAAGHRS